MLKSNTLLSAINTFSHRIRRNCIIKGSAGCFLQSAIKMRHFDNPYNDYSGGIVTINKNKVLHLIRSYINQILDAKSFGDGDLYVGKSYTLSISYFIIFNPKN